MRDFDFTYAYFSRVEEWMERYGVTSNLVGDLFEFNDAGFFIPDLFTALDGFHELEADPEEVGDAIAGMVLTHFDIVHAVPMPDLTLAICGRAA